MEPISESLHRIDKRLNKEKGQLGSKRLLLSEVEVDRVADWLASELGAGDDSRGFLCKTAKHFSRPYLTSIVSRSKRFGKPPMRLFIFLIRKEMDKAGIK